MSIELEQVVSIKMFKEILYKKTLICLPVYSLYIEFPLHHVGKSQDKDSNAIR